MTAWISELHKGPTWSNEIKKTKLQFHTPLQAGINIFVVGMCGFTQFYLSEVFYHELGTLVPSSLPHYLFHFRLAQYFSIAHQLSKVLV